VLFASDGEFFGNGLQTYMEAYVHQHQGRIGLYVC